MFAPLLNRLSEPFRALAIRFERGPIDNVEALTEFVRTRSSYVAQTSLYGYLKTRMGTQFRAYFEDEAFSVTIRVAAVRLFVSCLGDLTVYAVAISGGDSRLATSEAEALARHCFKLGMERGLVGVPPGSVPPNASLDFARRSAGVLWRNAADGAAAFTGSQEDIVRFAPVIDEFKELDREIVSNSIRFRWRDIREQLRKRIDADAVCNDWRNLDAGAAEPNTARP